MQEVTIEAPLVNNVGLAIARPQLEKYVPSVHRAHGFVRPDDALSRLLRANMETIMANAATMTLGDARGVSDAMLQLVASGRGIAALPQWAVAGYLAKGYVVARRIGPQGLTGQLFAAVPERMDRKPYVRDFVSVMRETSLLNLPGVVLL